MIEITEKIRSGIVMHIDSITLAEASEIADQNSVGTDTVYRYMRDIRKGKQFFKNDDVIMALAKLAMSKKKASRDRHKRASDLEKQLSNIR